MVGNLGINFDYNKQSSSKWFRELRNQMIGSIEKVDNSSFKETQWDRDQGGGGLMSILKGDVFEKVGVNISTVYGKFSEEFRKNIPGTEKDPLFWASGISIVAHMKNPKIAAAHFNTRYIVTSSKSWFGGGCDLTPAIPEERETVSFHSGLKRTLDQHNQEYYSKFKKECDEYFYLKHRKEPRGIGGIFFDYLNTDDFEKDLNFIKDVGQFFANFIITNTNDKKELSYDQEDLKKLSHKRSRYVEFNLLHDRGTLFGLKTGGNIEAILMSMPPEAKWE
ncbi:oxygen-dependent coproporphyrinogen oxidase [Alphaproteobacteria bacterium]|nr:oxygen-dependent coproporphyrinogen oxidase [Alphaproteobacteria bacterium]